MTRQIEHITMTSGGARMSGRDEVGNGIVDTIRLAIAEGGAIPGTAWRIVLMRAPEGVHCYDLLHDGHPVATCLLCTDPARSAEAWRYAEMLPRPPGVIIHAPQGTPWLAAALRLDHPALADPAAFADVLHEAGDLERCVAWALIE